jgi:Zn-dependent peptidase ImmA (M78 family)
MPAKVVLVERRKGEFAVADQNEAMIQTGRGIMATREPNDRGARARAGEVLQESGIVDPPIIPEAIAAALPFSLPIEFSSDFPEGAFGALYKDGNDFRIVVSGNCPTPGFRRFTLSHELGHFFLDGHLDALFDNGVDRHVSSTSQFRGMTKLWFEREADTFASELLVPTSMGHRVIAKTRSGIESVHAIADRFETSLSCAAVRYSDLTDAPIVIILSKDGIIEWLSQSRSVREHWWSRRSMKGEVLMRNSATARLARSTEKVKACETVDGDGWLNEWLEGAPAINLTEEAVGMGSYGRVLTVLTCGTLPSADAVREAEHRARKGPSDWREAMRPWGWDKYEEVTDE